MTTYSDKLKDPRWQKKRLEVLSRDNWTCVYCDDKTKTLHVHHEKYSGDPWETHNDHLKTCCSVCHTAISFMEKSNFWNQKFLAIYKDNILGDVYRCFVLIDSAPIRLIHFLEITDGKTNECKDLYNYMYFNFLEGLKFLENKTINHG